MKAKLFVVVTIVKGRRQQLANQALGIAASTVLPAAHVVVLMDADPLSLPETAVPLRVHRTVSDSGKLPLAAARNLGYRMTEAEDMIFLDVDCVPSPTLFESLLRRMDENTIVTAYPRYLRVVPEPPVNYDQLLSQSVEHPGRSKIPADKPVRPELFWSLVFGIRKNTMERIGGFDEGYVGYGAEDTDFALSAEQQEVEVVFAQDTILHQYHDKYDPPLQHLDDIISNATLFYKKWGVWPMESWLKAFASLGFIEMHGDSLRKLKAPTAGQIAAAHSTSPY